MSNLDKGPRQRLRANCVKRNAALNKLIAPARAALNAMKDAGLTASAEALAIALFEYDAADGELEQIIRNDLAGTLQTLIEEMERNEGT
jgi:hypothetical protein